MLQLAKIDLPAHKMITKLVDVLNQFIFFIWYERNTGKILWINQ